VKPSRHGEQPGDDARRIADVLEVVQDEQELSRPDPGLNDHHRVSIGRNLQPERGRNRGRHQLGVAQSIERDEPAAVLVVADHLLGDAQRETRFAGPAGARERQQTHVVAQEQSEYFAEFLLAAEERCCRDRQIRLVQALQRRKLAVAELVDPFGCRQILQAVHAEIAQPVADESRRRR
jgi:hypothetical protein